MVRFPVPCSGHRRCSRPAQPERPLGLRLSCSSSRAPAAPLAPTASSSSAVPATSTPKVVRFVEEAEVKEEKEEEEEKEEVEVLSAGSQGNSICELSTTDSESHLEQGPCKLKLKPVALAVQASNRLFRSSGSRNSSRDGSFDGRRILSRTSKFLRTGSFNKSKHEQIRELTGLLEPGMPLAHFSDFAKAYGDEAFCGRLLKKYPDNLPRCAEKLKQALIWREQNRVLLTLRNCPQAGDYRVIGADLERHPVLYMCMRNQLLPMGQCVDFMMVAMLQAIDNMPAGVETATHIWDLHGMMLRLNWNPAPLVAILKAAEGYFAERMQQLIIVDMPRMANFIKDAVWPLVPEKTREKVKFMTVEESQAFVGRACPEDVGLRVRGAMAQNRDSDASLEERKRSWVRVDKHGEVVPVFA